MHIQPIWSGHPETLYTPLEKLPPGTRMLFDYNPELARQMLDECGVPDPFVTDLIITGTEPDHVEIGSLLQEQWAKIGIDLQIVAYDHVIFWEKTSTCTYRSFAIGGSGTANPSDAIVRFCVSDQPLNFSRYASARVDELCALAGAEMDPAKRDAFYKEAGIIITDEVQTISIRPQPASVYYWPWVKNYYNETALGDNDSYTPLAYAWIDQELKAEMGY